MSEQTPSQAEGEPQRDRPEEETSGLSDVPRTTPSQAEGEDTQGEDAEQSEERAEWESGWSGP
ncbi:hypothetical protein ACIF85_03430 [Streptomyces sp. NPDC086033]|uniref:hypothetical protein n=1 Tax=Streptomyces sp. NPDC086033 TaxID=3365747 RepID=UPI0037D3A6A4